MLARAVREVEAGVQRGRASASVRTKFQTVALLAREERTRVKTATSLNESQRTEQLKRLDGIGTILAKTAALDPTLLSLLAEDAEVSDASKELKREMLVKAGLEAPDEPDSVGRGGARARGLLPSGGPAVGHLPTARRPLPRAAVRDHRAPHPSAASPGQLGADRPAALVVRACRERLVGLHGPA